MKKFFVRTTDGKWEMVTPYVYTNRKFVVDPQTNQPRYSGETIIQDGDELNINGVINANELGKLCRFFHVKEPIGTYTPIVIEPENVLIVRGNMTRLHVLKTGENWSKAPANKPKQQAENAA